MRIEELVSMDLQGEFRSDVQLSDYENESLNRELLKNYIFTIHAPATFGAAQRDYAAKDVLEALKTAFTIDRPGSEFNRIVLTANYGRGKSHLALTLANFFARSIDSKEVKIVLGRLEQALNNPSQFAGYRDFKKIKGEFLVVRLQGDRLDDLQEGFLSALSQALREHDSTRRLELPFWHTYAESWLKSLTGSTRQKAEDFLAEQNTDLPSLTADLRKQGSYALVREVFKHVTGAYPDFGREVNLEDLAIWVVDEVCIPKKMGGLLILFDEFSLFLQKYAAARSVGKLQELLNGISKRPGKSAFLAFSQQDVDTVTETYAQGQRREDVKKELERLPKDKRARLFSLMEGVLDSYLKQDESVWTTWRNRQSVKSALVQAREIVLEHFGKHYSNELQWNPEAFEQKVIKGCFPLHPLTTAILSIHNFEAGAGESPRTALQFVRRAWEGLRKQPSELADGKPNFVFPIALVDFFGDQISKKWYAAYRNALESSPQSVSDEQRKVLQALLIQQAVGLKASAGEQIMLLCQLTGLEREIVKSTLKELVSAKIVQSDPINKITSLWPASTRPQEVEEVIQKAFESIPVDHALMQKIVSTLASPEISLGFGHTSDWSPRQIALTAEMFTVEELKKLLQPYRATPNGIEEGPRGLIIWLIAQSEEEKIRLRQNGQSILDTALGNTAHPLPVVLILPKHPVPTLVEFTRRLTAIETLKGSEREKIGTVIYQQELGLAKTNFKNALDDLIGGVEGFSDIQRSLVEYALPAAYRTSVQAIKNLSLKSVVTECYRQAYAYRVEFYSQYAVGGKGPNKLREAVQSVTRWLLSDTAGSSIRNLRSQDIQHQLSTYYLMQKWGLLTAETYAVQRPTLRALQEAWDLLDQTFSPGCKETRVQPVLLTLFNPPYGHDYNTLTLLVAAWIGYHQHEISLALSGQRVAISQLQGFCDELKSPQEFINRISILSPLSISRVKSDELFSQINGVLEQIRQGIPFTIPGAQDALAKLEQAQANPRLPETKRDEIEKLRPRLKDALQKARDYDQQASEWLNNLTSGDFDTLLNLDNVAAKLPTLTLVSASHPPLEELQNQWETILQRELEAFCAKNTIISDLADYKALENRLKHVRKKLERYPSYVRKVDDALKLLTQRRDELKQQESEKRVVAEINSMTPSAALAVLYEYRERLEKLTDISLQTARLRDKKKSQIENRITQFERIAEGLPQAIQDVTQPNELRQQRDLLLRNLEQVEGTSHHKSLITVQKKIEQLEKFFEQVGALDAMPRGTPAELDAIYAQIEKIEKRFSEWLSPNQVVLLKKKRKEIEDWNRHETQEARSWLMNLEQCYRKGDNPESLLRQLEMPPAFLSQEGLARLDKLKRQLQQKINDDVILQIEILFKKISDPSVRRKCLKRLQELIIER